MLICSHVLSMLSLLTEANRKRELSTIPTEAGAYNMCFEWKKTVLLAGTGAAVTEELQSLHFNPFKATTEVKVCTYIHTVFVMIICLLCFMSLKFPREGCHWPLSINFYCKWAWTLMYFHSFLFSTLTWKTIISKLLSTFFNFAILHGY